MGFHTWAAQAQEPINIETCHVLLVAWCRFQLVKNHMPWNMSLETHHPPKLVKLQRAT
jgi:hypothetical protein